MKIDFHEKMNQKLEEQLNKALENNTVEYHSMEEFIAAVDTAFAKMADAGKE